MPVDIVEMFWRCDRCNAKKTNLGRNKECTNDQFGIGCGAPKASDAEEWLPDDVSHTSAHVVTEDTVPGLLEKFKAGADVPCPFCDSLQWMVNGTCTNCTAPMDGGKREPSGLHEESYDSGAPVTVVPRRPSPVHKPVHDIGDEKVQRTSHAIRNTSLSSTLAGLAVAATVILASGGIYMACRTVEHPATVTATEWRYVAHVDRNTEVHEEGWSPPGGAHNVVDQGLRFHHNRDVLDHYDTERYSVEESCGQTCTTVPRVCTKIPQSCITTPRSCTPNKNGSATCSGGDRVCSGGGESCTGGGQSCSTKYCTVWKDRQKPVYRQEPVNQNWYTWNVWRWIPNRDIPSTGTDAAPEAPSTDRIALADRERVLMELTCSVTFTADDDHRQYTYKPSNCDTEFRVLPKGTKKVLLVSAVGNVKIKPVTQK